MYKFSDIHLHSPLEGLIVDPSEPQILFHDYKLLGVSQYRKWPKLEITEEEKHGKLS